MAKRRNGGPREGIIGPMWPTHDGFYACGTNDDFKPGAVYTDAAGNEFQKRLSTDGPFWELTESASLDPAEAPAAGAEEDGGAAQDEEPAAAE